MARVLGLDLGSHSLKGVLLEATGPGTDRPRLGRAAPCRGGDPRRGAGRVRRRAPLVAATSWWWRCPGRRWPPTPSPCPSPTPSGSPPPCPSRWRESCPSTWRRWCSTPRPRDATPGPPISWWGGAQGRAGGSAAALAAHGLDPRVVTHPAIAYQSLFLVAPERFEVAPGATVAVVDVGHRRTSVAVGRPAEGLVFARTFRRRRTRPHPGAGRRVPGGDGRGGGLEGARRLARPRRHGRSTTVPGPRSSARSGAHRPRDPRHPEGRPPGTGASPGRAPPPRRRHRPPSRPGGAPRQRAGRFRPTALCSPPSPHRRSAGGASPGPARPTPWPCAAPAAEPRSAVQPPPGRVRLPRPLRLPPRAPGAGGGLRRGPGAPLRRLQRRPGDPPRPAGGGGGRPAVRGDPAGPGQLRDELRPGAEPAPGQGEPGGGRAPRLGGQPPRRGCCSASRRT